MALTDCQKCKYFDRNPHHLGDALCGLKPAYAAAFDRLKSLDQYTRSCLPIDSCQDFELNPALEEKALSLSLNFSDWQKLIRESSNLALAKALSNVTFRHNLSLTVEQWQQIANSTSIPTVRVTLQSLGIEAQRTPWIHVDSDCIDAIAFDESTLILKIRFRSGSVYEYYGFDPIKFSDFLNAFSHGGFFHREIKDIYDFSEI